MTAPVVGPPPRRFTVASVADGLASLALLAMQGAAALYSFWIAAAGVMVTAACSPEHPCGDPNSVKYAMSIAFVGGVVLGVGSLAACLTLIAARRPSCPVATLCLVLQLLLYPLVIAVAEQAGPL